MVTDRRNRGQVILIGAISLAFIILGIVVVFNGVLYTETLSSGPASQSGPDAAATELEIERGVGCLLERVDSGVDADSSADYRVPVQDNLSDFANAYQASKAGSEPVLVNVSVAGSDAIENESNSLESVAVNITYDSREISYTERNRTIRATCPHGGP